MRLSNNNATNSATIASEGTTFRLPYFLSFKRASSSSFSAALDVPTALMLLSLSLSIFILFLPYLPYFSSSIYSSSSSLLPYRNASKQAKSSCSSFLGTRNRKLGSAFGDGTTSTSSSSPLPPSECFPFETDAPSVARRNAPNSEDPSAKLSASNSSSSSSSHNAFALGNAARNISSNKP